MPRYQIKTAKQTKALGYFEDFEQVKKLRMFKNSPALLSYVEEVPAATAVAKLAKRYNRWRVILSESYYDLLGRYSKAEAEDIFIEHTHGGWLRLVHKYEYHASDGPLV